MKFNDNNQTEVLNRLGATPIRVLSFQTFYVFHSILRHEHYTASLNLTREHRDYSEDIAQLGGTMPIWGFTPTAFVSDSHVKFEPFEFTDGTLFDRFRCEMSLPDHESLNHFILLELSKPASELLVGKTHNAFSGSVVFSKIELSELCGLYSLYYPDEDSIDWFYPVVHVLQKYCSDPLFTCDFKCHKVPKVTKFFE